MFTAQAAETLESCIQDPPVNPVRDASCALQIYSANDLKLDASKCLGIMGANCPSFFPCGVVRYLQTKCVSLGYQTVRTTLCTEGPRGAGCCINDENSPKIAIADGVCTNEVEDCENGGVIHYSCCVCEAVLDDGRKTIMKVADKRQTYSSCQELCKKVHPNARPYVQAGAGALPPPAAASREPSAAQLQEKLATCFTQQDCASSEYGGAADAFRPGFGCPAGQGRCVAPEPEIKLSYPIGNITTVKGFRNFVAIAFNYGIGIVAIVAAVMFVWGGFRYMFGAAFQDVKRGKEILVDAAVGLVIALGSMTILRTINPDTLNFSRLDVFMINKSQLLSSRFCADIKTSGANKPLMFAEAGLKPAYTPIDQIKSFSVAGSDTRCNYEYYGEGFNSDSRCYGRKCDNPGEACVACKGGACSPGADPSGYGCVQAAWSGSIAYVGAGYASQVGLFAVCNNFMHAKTVVKNGSSEPIDDGVKQVEIAKLTGTKGESGKQVYTFGFDAKTLSEATTYCKDKGDVGGFLLGLVYHDTTLLVGGHDDVAVIGKSNCSGAKFLSYIDGTLANQFESELAIECGLFVSGKPSADVSNYWTMAELQAGIGIGGQDPKPLICDLQLDPAINVPPDPGSKSKQQIKINDEFVCGVP